MAIKPKQLPPLEALRAETVWPGDDAFDQDSPDLSRFLTSLGEDTGVLKLKGKEKPARVIYRALDPLELDAAIGRGASMLHYEACRYGLVSIDGIDLERVIHRNGLEGLSQECLTDLTKTVFMDMPVRLAINALNRQLGQNVKERSDDLALKRTPITFLIGLFIQALTFRTR
jgi:hypothetical protein